MLADTEETQTNQSWKQLSRTGAQSSGLQGQKAGLDYRETCLVHITQRLEEHWLQVRLDPAAQPCLQEPRFSPSFSASHRLKFILRFQSSFGTSRCSCDGGRWLPWPLNCYAHTTLSREGRLSMFIFSEVTRRSTWCEGAWVEGSILDQGEYSAQPRSV